MKKLLALLLAAMMVLALVACTKEETPADTGETEETAAETGETAADTGETEAEGYTGDALAFDFTTTYQQTETGGEVIQYFVDELSKMSDGKITVNVLWGGTVYDSSSELEAVSSGAVQMDALGHLPHAAELPMLTTFPDYAPGSTQNTLDYFNYIMFDNAETATLIEDEATANGIKYLNVIAGGANAFCATFDFSDLASLVAGSQNFGNFSATAFEALGFNVTSMVPPDIYDALDRGIIDATQMALEPMVALGWNDVAPYFMLDSTYAAGNFFTVNLEWWDGLTAEQREILQTAADATEAYSVTMFDGAIEDTLAQLETSGTTIIEMSDADSQLWWSTVFNANADAKLAASSNVENTTKILQAAADFTNYDWQPAA